MLSVAPQGPGAQSDAHGCAVIRIVGRTAALRTLAGLIVIALATQAGSAAAGGGSREEREASAVQTEPTRTVKERLSGKASDEQRVDNCKVPVDQRGSKPRPDACRAGASAAPRR